MKLLDRVIIRISGNRMAIGVIRLVNQLRRTCIVEVDGKLLTRAFDRVKLLPRDQA